MIDRHFAVEFSLSYPEAEPDVIVPLVEKLRLKAIGLAFLQVSEVFTLKEEPLAVCYFTCTLPDGDFTEIGLERQPTEIEFDGFIVPGGMPEWSKWGTVSTSKLSLLSRLLHHAAELGFGSSLSFAGITLDYWRVGGKVQVQQTWGTVPARACALFSRLEIAGFERPLPLKPANRWPPNSGNPRFSRQI